MEITKILIAKINDKQTYQSFLALLHFFQALTSSDSLYMCGLNEGLVFYRKEKQKSEFKCVTFIQRSFFTEFKYFSNIELPNFDFELRKLTQIVKTLEIFKQK